MPPFPLTAAPLGDTASAARAAVGGEAQGDFLAALAGLGLPEAAAQLVPASRPAMTPSLPRASLVGVPTPGAEVAPLPVVPVAPAPSKTEAMVPEKPVAPSPVVPVEAAVAPPEAAPVSAPFTDPELSPATSLETEVDAEAASPADAAPQSVAIAKPEIAASDPALVQPAALPPLGPVAPQPPAQVPVPLPAQAAPGQAQIPQPVGEIAVTTLDERSPGQPLKRKEGTFRTTGDLTAASLDPAVAALDTVPVLDIAAVPAVAVAVTPAEPRTTASISENRSTEPAGRATTAQTAPEITASPRHSADHAAPASRGELPAPATPDPVAIAEPRVAAPIFSQTLDAAIARHAAPPYPPAQAEPATATVALREGRFGTDVGVAIARALDSGPEGACEALLIRLDPRHMGRVDVRMSFDDDGTLRAVVSADSPAALDMLRRESAQLDRSLADAGVRSDAQSLRFDAAGNGAGGQHRHGARQQLPMPQSGGADGFVGAQDGGHSDYRSLRGSGHIDLMA